ncbi:MAG: hypothetical protein F4Y80_05060 [Caldilineaceae bacterium SB0665_bin_21]|nr:hypothetical protein [Caldilineaceae bacterium SB0665_bin_21]MYA05892.1 hypothetical protein [Caldilineaceae bacterium SB0664_bin_22]
MFVVAAMVTPKGISARNRYLLTSLIRSVTGPFTVQEAATTLALPITRTQRFLAYLAERGWLVRVCRGLYAPVPLDAIHPDEWREDPWVIAAKLFGPDYYIGGWTACENWSLTEQIFLDTVVLTTRETRRKEVSIQGFPFLVKHVSESRVFGTKPVWRDQTKVDVSDPSRTLVDILEVPSIGGGLRHVVDIMDRYFKEEYRNDELLVAYVRQVGNRVVFKRLGFLLEVLNVHAPELLRACEDSVSSGVSRLDPGLPNRGPVAWRWNLRVNRTIQLEEEFS